MLAAALVGGYRAVKHFNRVSEMAESDNPTKDLTSKVTTTFAGSLTPKKKDDTEKEAKQIKKEAKYDGKYVSTSPLSGATAFDVAIPVGAALLAAAGVYKAVDSWANARRNRLLDAGIAAKDNALKQLMQTRARVAKGMAT